MLFLLKFILIVMACDNLFWQRLDELLTSKKIVIDRPKGSRHPRFSEIVYQLDYGYLEGTSSNDGEGVDVWLGSDVERGLDAVICTVDLDRGDAEMKLMGEALGPSSYHFRIHLGCRFALSGSRTGEP